MLLQVSNLQIDLALFQRLDAISLIKKDFYMDLTCLLNDRVFACMIELLLRVVLRDF